MVPDNNPPFLAWCAALAKLGAATREGNDIVLSDLGGKRFGLGVHKAQPLLCWLDEDHEALNSIKWTSAALAYDLKGRDWVALSAQDIRVKGSAVLQPVRLRLFVPVTAGRLDAWRNSSPESLHVARMKTLKGSPVMDGDPFRQLPLKLLAK